jgi:hypothetical protein
VTDIERQVAEHFGREVAELRMTVLHNAPVYRHLRFKAPGTGIGHFDLVTWPGHLTICGDREAYTFTRVYDMFEFFRGRRINPMYWSEKMIGAGRRQVCKEYSEDLFRQMVTDHLDEAEEDWPGVTDAWREHAANYEDATFESAARDALEGFTYPDTLPRDRAFQFYDTWEWDLTDWDWHFVWSCYAIQWGIRYWDTGQPPTFEVPPAPKPVPVRAVITTFESIVKVELPAVTR